MSSNSHLKIWAAAAVALMLAVAVSPALASEDTSAADSSTATIDIGKGMEWSWTPTFNIAGTTVSIYASSSTFTSTSPTLQSKYSETASGYATVADGTVTVSIPEDYSKSNYYLAVRGTTTNPDQSVFYKITFRVSEYGVSYGSDINGIRGVAIDPLSPEVTSRTGTTVTSWSIDKALPSGITFQNGVFSGTPTTAAATDTYTVTATMSPTAEGPTFDVTTTVSITIVEPTSIDASNVSVYAITGKTSISVPAFSSTGTLTTKVSKDGAAATAAGSSYIGLTISAAGKITGKPNAPGTYVFTQTLSGAATGTRTVTLTVEDQVTASNTKYIYAIEGTATTFPTEQTGGPANVNWYIRLLKVNGSRIGEEGQDVPQNLVAEYGLTVDNHGNLKTSAATPAGTYQITLKAYSASDATTSGATGTSPANNAANPYYVLVVAPELVFTNTPTASCAISGASR